MLGRLFSLILFLIIFSGLLFTVPALGQIVDPITVMTDKSAYAVGETIVISGEVSDLLGGVPVSLQVIAANGNLILLAQISVNSDKSFSVLLQSGGPLWESEGTYTIKAIYGSQSRTDETTFLYGDVFIGGTDIPIDTVSLLVYGIQNSFVWWLPAVVIAGAGVALFKIKKKN